jgi:dTDP-4-dehydrorhamnose reductase
MQTKLVKSILVTGSNGQLGKDLQELSYKDNYKFFFTDKNSLDITNKDKIDNFVKNNKIDLIINFAAYTDVNKAQLEEKKANLINNISVKNLAQICAKNNILLIHISTDYVFDGKNYKPYKEDDKTNPINIYGLTKLKGEEAFIKSGARGIIIRTSWLYCSEGKNFVNTMLKLAKNKNKIDVVCDQIGTPTYCADLNKAMLNIINNHLEKLYSFKGEIFHYSNEGVASWYDFAKEIFDLKNIKVKINAIETKDFPSAVNRPYYSVLNKTKFKNIFQMEIPYWKDSLKICLQRINNV